MPTALTCWLAFALAAAPPSPIHWQVGRAPTQPLKAGAKFTLTLTAHIDAGWHLYALEEPEGGPIATDIALAEGDAATVVKVDEPKPRTIPDPASGAMTALFENAATFTLHLQALPTGARTLHVLVRFQTCNDHFCLPPHTDTLEVPLPPAR